MSNLIIRKGTQMVMTLCDSGDASFGSFYEEQTLSVTASGELSIRKGASSLMGTRNTGSQSNVQLKRRLSDKAVFPNQGLSFRSANGTQQQAELHTLGDLYIRRVVTNVLTNPSTPGTFGYSSIVYAAPGLSYAGMANPYNTQYAVFQSPAINYSTRRIDLSDFGSVTSVGWPFDENDVPINGLLRVPNGSGPFPLALFVHGNHNPAENSTSGYIYLMELLASHGIIAGSVDCNFLNGWNSGENDARAIVHLEHLKQFRIWNQQAGHPLFGKVNLQRIMIVGHSRGGEAVGHACLFNTLSTITPDPGDPAVPMDGSLGLGPYGFTLNVAAAISPTDNQYQPVSGPVQIGENYFVVHGSRDGDVWDFSGYKTYDRAHPINLANPTQSANGWKSLLWVWGANHNYFNSVWASEGTPTITRVQQEGVAKVYFGALARGKLLAQSQYLNLIKNHTLATSSTWITGITLVSQYQDWERLFICHYEEDAIVSTLSTPVNGSVDVSNVSASELFFNNGGFLREETHGLKLNWNIAGKSYTININPGGLTPGFLQNLVFRAGQSNEANNISPRDQNFSIRVADGNSNYTVVANTLALFPFPEQGRYNDYKMVMQRLSLPLQTLSSNGIDINDIRSITFLFDQPVVGTASVQGTLYFDEIQLSK